MKGTYIIYGGSGGMGSAIARRIASSGGQVHLVGRNRERLASLADELHATYTVGNVTDPELFIQATEEVGDCIDGLVYAVGTINLRGFQRLELPDYIHDFQINAVGAALSVRAALKGLKKSQAASVVLFSSVAAERGFSFHASMGMAKAAVSGLTRSLAAELAPAIRVNAIAPSLVKTPLTEKMLAVEKTVQTIEAMHPLKRLGEPDEMASLAAYLLSADSGWMTGQVISSDGGRSTLAGS
ncbi:SDR family oxidoreductase [Pontiellaceae bacterium B12227]|nr:SDR family oxidoreductase [Pontiellaceae bacterium B12227]